MARKDPEERRAYNKAYQEAHREELAAYHREYRATHRAEATARELRRRFGITLEDYDRMLEAQHGVCMICGRPPKHKRLAVDHNHKTGEPRSLLCDGCNRFVVFVLERFPNRIACAQAYLRGELTEPPPEPL